MGASGRADHIPLRSGWDVFRGANQRDLASADPVVQPGEAMELERPAGLRGRARARVAPLQRAVRFVGRRLRLHHHHPIGLQRAAEASESALDFRVELGARDVDQLVRRRGEELLEAQSIGRSKPRAFRADDGHAVLSVVVRPRKEARVHRPAFPGQLDAAHCPSARAHLLEVRHERRGVLGDHVGDRPAEVLFDALAVDGGQDGVHTPVAQLGVQQGERHRRGIEECQDLPNDVIRAHQPAYPLQTPLLRECRREDTRADPPRRGPCGWKISGTVSRAQKRNIAFRGRTGPIPHVAGAWHARCQVGGHDRPHCSGAPHDATGSSTDQRVPGGGHRPRHRPHRDGVRSRPHRGPARARTAGALAGRPARGRARSAHAPAVGGHGRAAGPDEDRPLARSRALRARRAAPQAIDRDSAEDLRRFGARFEHDARGRAFGLILPLAEEAP